jgi:peptide/nickel transport system ATP-binding protein
LEHEIAPAGRKPYLTLLSVEHLNVSYTQGKGKTALQVLNDISFTLGKGELLTLLGESGSGKSTCGMALLGLLPPSAQIGGGTLQLRNETPIDLGSSAADWRSIRGKRVAMIYQDAQLALNPIQTIRVHFQETMRFHKLGTPKEIEEKSRKMLSLLNFDDPERVLDSYPFELSGGMCQRVCIALILSLQPEVLIADEPTSALDSVSQKEVLNLLQDVRKRFDLSVLLITHDIGVAYKVSDRIIVLEQGSIVDEGPVAEVLLRPRKEYTRTLVAARNFSNEKLPVQRKTGELLLRVEGLGKVFGRGLAPKGKDGVRALAGLNFDLYRKETVGILGFSGCGKSTLARCIVGLEAPDAGKITYHGQDITYLRGKKRQWVCKNMQMVFQDARASLNSNRTAFQLVQESLKYLKLGTKREREEKARHYLARVGLAADTQNRRPPQLSTGQCQRVAIARALVVEPDVLLCDEAVSALDMIVRKQILDLLQDLQRTFGFAIVMISHDIRVIRHFCQMVAVMKDGRFLEFVPTGLLGQEPGSDYTRSLFDSEIHML